ncbi:hypothetical protein I6N90_01130 [Paenibacillus sp. GSMTC-2017]|uniref:hypothetical protein n=1 Tax=Paenibacillus sp. GSMTC-2017 TaxID=2794350 RepID=UPI0018DA2A00|nr:hypothetical protein [Paenibacillus sp. GSMTC-2017]MBH5316407.1 hypothetical protein [Paenibacillus sp. GSMTC-2017]
MSTGLIGQLVVADQVISDDHAKAHIIQHVRNHILLQTYPAVAIIKVWVKIWIIDNAENIVYVRLYDSNNSMIWEKEFDDIVNMRPSQLPAGKDFSFEVRFVVHDAGLFKVVMFDQHNEKLAEYPMYVSRGEQ